ncbi:MFS transporter [Defluviimonas sp. 20V17]|uniref:MFS transporter n=1 Tax=Allgaiera indica TaxID=765699 RepID=A0AAN4UU26_9RHOB|nr:MFS transporter [Allgaiera indica]KDB05274.1 MFS transporter [Defluviimonas sp. 20V17]GHE04908.1 MFS transporter [Allgaiera indica]SDX59399.1 Predicted arabinose efflux permease, MFS family [Allgaiera indica]
MATDTTTPAAGRPAISAALTLLLATACGMIAANLYYAQPLVDPIRTALHMPPAAAGLIVTLTQVGFGLGLLLLVPLADKVENRALVLGLIGLAAAGLLVQAMAPSAAIFLAAGLAIGLGSVAVQVLVPYASHMAPEAVRGRVVGNVMSGLMFGIMLARPVASFVTESLSWHAIFLISSLAMVALAGVLARSLPPRRPASRPSYAELLVSMGRLVRDEPVLRRRALYQAAMFGVFTLFWTCVPLLLLGPAYGLSQNGVALFALAGVSGAVSAPIAGWLADRGLGQPGTVAAMLGAGLAVLATLAAPHGTALGLGILVAAAVMIDFCTTANMVISQRMLFVLHPDLRARINGIYMATFFMGGALASGVGGWAYASGGWPRVVLIGVIVPLAALAYFATERRAAS